MFAVLAFCLASMALAAQQISIVPDTATPKADGSVAAGEYQASAKAGQATVQASLGSDGLLYLAFSAPTKGWVALGTNSLRMDGASMYMGFDAGTPQFTEQTGSGHSHKPSSGQTAKAWAVKTSGAETTLELVLPAEAAVSGGKLKLIWAYGRNADFRSPHAARGSLEIAVKD
jgi:hypothetical protein